MSLRELNRHVEELRRGGQRVPADEHAMFVVLTDTYSYPCFKYFVECCEPRQVNDLAFFRSSVSFLDKPTFVVLARHHLPITTIKQQQKTSTHEQ